MMTARLLLCCALLVAAALATEQRAGKAMWALSTAGHSVTSPPTRWASLEQTNTNDDWQHLRSRFTVSLWVNARIGAATGAQTVISRNAYAGARLSRTQFELRVLHSAADSMSFELRVGCGNNTDGAADTSDLAVSLLSRSVYADDSAPRWMLVEFTVNGNDSDAELCVDGGCVRQAFDASCEVPWRDQSRAINIGWIDDEAREYNWSGNVRAVRGFDGEVDDLKIIVANDDNDDSALPLSGGVGIVTDDVRAYIRHTFGEQHAARLSVLGHWQMNEGPGSVNFFSREPGVTAPEMPAYERRRLAGEPVGHVHPSAAAVDAFVPSQARVRQYVSLRASDEPSNIEANRFTLGGLGSRFQIAGCDTCTTYPKTIVSKLEVIDWEADGFLAQCLRGHIEVIDWYIAPRAALTAAPSELQRPSTVCNTPRSLPEYLTESGRDVWWSDSVLQLIIDDQSELFADLEASAEAPDCNPTTTLLEHRIRYRCVDNNEIAVNGVVPDNVDGAEACDKLVFNLGESALTAPAVGDVDVSTYNRFVNLGNHWVTSPLQMFAWAPSFDNETQAHECSYRVVDNDGEASVPAIVDFVVEPECASGVYDECGVCDGDGSSCTCRCYHGTRSQFMDYQLTGFSVNDNIARIDDALAELREALAEVQKYAPGRQPDTPDYNAQTRVQRTFEKGCLVDYCDELHDYVEHYYDELNNDGFVPPADGLPYDRCACDADPATHVRK